MVQGFLDGTSSPRTWDCDYHPHPVPWSLGILRKGSEASPHLPEHDDAVTSGHPPAATVMSHRPRAGAQGHRDACSGISFTSFLGVTEGPRLEQ